MVRSNGVPESEGGEVARGKYGGTGGCGVVKLAGALLAGVSDGRSPMEPRESSGAGIGGERGGLDIGGEG